MKNNESNMNTGRSNTFPGLNLNKKLAKIVAWKCSHAFIILRFSAFALFWIVLIAFPD